ncbi:MAG: hypothetical protein ACLFSA_11215 [Spirochaetaceae bacterium]
MNNTGISDKTDYKLFSAAGPLKRTLRFFSPIIIFLAAMLVLLLWVSNPLGADEKEGFSGTSSAEAAERVKESLKETGYSPEDVQKVLDVYAQAESEKIPLELLMSRVQEGAAKGVAAGRLASALERDIDNLRVARNLLEEVEGGDALVGKREQWQRAANMRAAGMDDEEIQSLAYICREKPEAFRHSTILYVSLTKWGLSKEETLDVTAALVYSSIPSEEYEGVLELYRKAQRERMRPEVLSERLVEQLTSADSIEQIEERILE